MNIKVSIATCMICLGFLACSDGDLTVTTQSNAPIVSEDGVGASIAIAGESADGTQSVNINTGSSSLGSQMRIQSFKTEQYVFCLEQNTGGRIARVLENETDEVLVLEEGTCAGTELVEGSHTILLN